MKKNFHLITVVVFSILSILLYVLASTYAIIIDVKDNNGINEIVGNIIVRDLLTDKSNNYNNLYYDIKNELGITINEANILIDSESVNEAFKTVLDSIVKYRVDKINDARLSNQELLNLISNAVNNTLSLSQNLRDRVINKANIYIIDISNYLYDIDINILD